MSETEYVIVGSKAWGRAEHQTDALENMVANKRNFEDTEEVMVCRVRGFNRIEFGSVYADEIVKEQVLEVDGDQLQKIHDLVHEAELTADTALAEANIVEESNE